MTRRRAGSSAATKRAITAAVGSLRSEPPRNEDYERLLMHFSKDPRRAEEEFLEFRERLIVFFDRRRCQDPELQADEAFTIAARFKDLNGVKDIRGFIYEIARRLALERGRSQRREPDQLGDVERLAPAETMNGTPEDSEDRKVREIRLQCLDSCLSKLPKRDRTLLLDYYREEKTEKLQLRRLLAATLGIRIGTLRTRLTRARTRIAACCEDCIQKSREQVKHF